MTLQLNFSYEQAQRHEVVYIACTNRKKAENEKSHPSSQDRTLLCPSTRGRTYKIPSQEIIYFRKQELKKRHRNHRLCPKYQL